MLHSRGNRDTPVCFNMGAASRITSSEGQLKDLRVYKPEEKQFIRKQNKCICAPQRTKEEGDVTGIDFGCSCTPSCSSLFLSASCFFL